MESRKDAGLHELAREKHEQRQANSQPTPTRRNLIRTAAIGGAGALLFGSATGSAAAAPSGTIPAPSDPALTKFRGDRLRLVERSGAPSAPSSGRVSFWTDSGDLQ